MQRFYDDDEGVVAAVNRGSVPVGVINSYYWERLNDGTRPQRHP